MKTVIQNFLTHYYDATLASEAATFASGDVISTTVEVALRSYANQDVDQLRGRIVSLQVLDEDDQGITLDVFFMKNNVSLGTVNSAISISDANAREIIGIVQANSFFDLINSRQAFPEFKDIPFVLDSGELSLWVSAVTRGAPTYTASGVRLRIGVQFENQVIDTGS